MNRFTVSMLASLALALLFALPAAAAGPADCTDIQTDKGAVTGVENSGVCEYKGVPFAAPPVGDLRFRLPQPAQPWTETLVADSFGSECFQYPMVDLSGNGRPSGSEDCLYLNIWAPQRPPLGKKPVMMFIHGGGFQNGSGTMDTYYGARLAGTGDVLVVTINYRLGPFGFFMHPALTEPDGSLEGNYGIYDQVAALKWIKTNIENFGGDPDNVTVFGESAGGMSIGMLLISPLTEGLFHKAVIESGPVFMITRKIEDTLPLGESMAAEMGCTDPATAAQCLRSASAEDIIVKLHSGIMFLTEPGKNKKFPAEPLIGGILIPDVPYKMFSDGRYWKNIPLIIGTNKDEFSFFVSKDDLDTREEFDKKISDDKQKIINVMGTDVFTSELIDMYDPADYPTPKKAYADLMGDVAFTCPARMLANAAAQNGTPVYLYRFTYEPEGVEMLGDWGAFHGSELPFVFGNMTFMGIKFPYTDNKKLSTKIRGLWAGFARDGAPSYKDAPQWPPYDPDNQPYMDLNLDMAPAKAFKKNQCEVYEKLTTAIFE